MVLIRKNNFSEYMKSFNIHFGLSRFYRGGTSNITALAAGEFEKVGVTCHELKKTIDGQTIETEKVPLAYGPKQKFLYRLQGNPSDGRKVAITLPRIYFEMTSIDYDGARKTSALQKYKI